LDEMRSTVSNVDAVEKELRTQLNLASEIESGGHKFRNGFMYNKDGDRVGGTTIYEDGWITRFFHRTSRIYISPGVKGLTENGHSLARPIINHEIIHAYHYNLVYRGKITGKDFQYSEAVAYAYNIAYYKTYGLTSQLKHARTFTTNLSGRPWIMSWWHLTNLTRFY